MNENAANALKEYRDKVASGEIEAAKQKDPIEASNEDPKSKAKAIKAMCFHCVGGSDTSNWRNEVRNCTSGNTCPLFKVRPYK